MTYTRLFCSLLLTSTAISGFASTDEETVGGITKRVIDHGAVPGMSVAVLRGNAVAFSGGFGEAEIDNHVRASAATIYRINSITKAFVAVAVLQLVEHGKIHLGDHLSQYFPEYTRAGHDPTLAQMLNHTSGLSSYTGSAFDKNIRLDLSAKQWVESLNDENLYKFAPGENWRYSNLAYDVLGLLIEKISGKPLLDYWRERVFQVAGMSATRLCNTPDVVTDRAFSYDATAQGWRHAESWGTYGDASGRLCSNVLDLSKFWMSLQSGQLISKASLKLMREGGKLTSGTPFGYGFGTRLGHLDGHALIAHTGDGESWTSALLYSPDHNITVIVLANCESQMDSAKHIARDILQRTAGLTDVTQQDLPVEASLLRRIIGTWGTEQPAEFTANGAHIAMQPKGAPQPMTLLYQGQQTFALGPPAPPGVEFIFDTRAVPYSAQVFQDGVFQSLQLK